MAGSDRQRKHERIKYSLSIAFCFIFLLCATYAAATINLPVFGPKRFDRLKGAPTVYTDTFERCRPSYAAVLRITNGDSQATRIKSASIVVNGVEVASENDFKQQAPYFEKTIAAADINQLTVVLKSGMQDDPAAKDTKDQSFLIIEIAGTGCDDTPPVISKPAPSDGSLVNAASPLVSARFADSADGSGTDPASASLNVDDRDVTLSASASQTGISYQPGTLPEGGHTVSAIVSDKAGNAAGLSWKFTTDTVPPSVAVTSHSNGQYLNAGMITVSGTVQDPAPAQPAFTTGPVIVTVNGAAAEVYGNEFILAGLALFEGPNSVQAEALDTAGNKSSAGIILYLDTVAPTVSITSPSDNAFLNTPVITVSGTISEEFTAVKVNRAAAAVSGTSYSLAGVLLAEGANTVIVEATDRAGNSGSGSIYITLDTVPPTAVISGAPASPTKASTANITVAGQDVVAYKYKLDSGPFHTETAPSTPIILDDLPEGTHSLAVIGKDPAGNWQPETGATIATWIVDRTAPALNISALPDGAFTNNNVLNISGTVTDNIGIQGISINDTPITVNEDGSFSQAVVLTPGTNRITATAMDQAGNRTTNDRIITLDMTAPQLVIISPADNSVTGAAEVNVTGTADETSIVSVKMNNEEAQTASIAGHDWNAASHLAYGQNTIEVTATDQAGNSTTDKRTVTFDNVNPALAVTNPAQDIRTNQSNIMIAGSVTDLTAPTVAITHDGSTYTPVVTNGTFLQVLYLSMEKTYPVIVQATDGAGNATTVQRNINYDRTPPGVGIDPVASPTTQVNQTIRGTMDEGARVSVSCSTASVGQVSYPTSVTWQAMLTNMTEGSNHVSVTAGDAAGNLSNPQAASIVLDTLVPDTIIGSGPAVITNVNTASFSFTSSEPVSTFECQLDNGAFSTCASPMTYASIVDGSHTFLVKATDASGNVDTTPVAFAWTVDTAAPTVQITAPQADVYLNTPSLTVTGTTAKPVASVTVNGASAVVTGTGFSFPSLSLAEGANAISVDATDAAGNAGSKTINITLDTIPPVIQVTAPPIGAILNTPLITVSGDIVDANVAGLWIDGNHIQLAGRNFIQANVALTEGTSTISLRASDRAGNESSITVPVTLDTIPPAVSITTPVAGALVKTQTVMVSGRISEQNATVLVNNVTVQVTGQDFTLADVPLADGPNTIVVRATDLAGNSGSANVNIIADSTPPSAPVIIQLHSPSPTPVVTVNGIAEAGSTVTLSMQSGQSAASVVGTATASTQGTFGFANVILAEGTSTFTAIAADSAGNTSSTSAPVSVMRDTAPPVITISSPANNIFTNQNTILVIGTLSEPATLTIDGSAVVLDGLNFTHSVSLTSATNFIVISARDLSNNTATLNWVVYLDQTLPVVALSAPAAGFLTRTPQVAVSGSVSEAPVSVIVNGVAATITNKNFTLANAALAEGQNTLTVAATDRAGNIGQATVNVVLDTQAPAATITAPTQAAAGTNITISCGTSDNIGLMNIDVLATGAPIWSTTLNSELSTLNAFAYSVSPDLAANTVLTFQARASDTAGNVGTSIANVQVTGGATGPGYIQGEVYDDRSGQLLAGATAVIFTRDGHELTRITTVEDGSYFTEAPAGDQLIVLYKDGFTTVERLVAVKSEKDALASDARLTAISEKQNMIDANGGTATTELAANGHEGARIGLTIPADAIDQQMDIRLTPIGNQGLEGVLPTGWSPIAVVDVNALTQNSVSAILNFNPAATLKVAVVSGLTLTASSFVTLVSYNTNSHQWIVREPGTVSTDGAFITANVKSTGQYAFVLPDQQAASSTFAPGAPLREIVSSALVSGVTMTGRVMPAVAPAAVGLTAVGEITISSQTSSVNSGSIVSAKVTERFDLLSGEVVLPSDYTQDLVLYKYPCLTSLTTSQVYSTPGASVAVKTVFPITPTHEYTIVDLMTGKIHLDIYSRESDTATGTMVGAEGARLLDEDGNVLSIPQGALTNTIPVATKTVSASTLAGVIGSDFILLRAVDVNLTGKTLSASAELSIPAPGGVSASLPIVVAKAIEIKGVKKLKLVALAKLSGSLVTSFATFAPLREIDASGLYLFLQSKAPLGIISGTVKDGAAKAYPSAQVTSNTCSLIDLTSSDGKYLVASTVANFSVIGSDIYKNDTGTRIDTITTANQTKMLDITINATPPYVVTVSPADAALRIDPKTQIVVTMSEAVKPESVTGNTVLLEDASGTKTQGIFSLSPDGTVITLYPENNFKSETQYTLTVTHSIQDMQGYFMGQDFVSHFTIKDTTPPPMPTAGSIVSTFPDADGYITITATQGSTEATGAVLIINDTSGEIVTVAPNTNGSFTGRIMAQLGDEIKIVSMDSSGNQTLVSYITFKSSDGKYLVTAKGGTVEGPGGLKLEIPEDALMGPTIIKILPVFETELPEDNPMPSGAKFLAAVNIDTGGANFQKEVQFSVPKPSDMPADAEPFVAQPTTLMNADGTVEKVFVIHDSAKVVNDRLSTACYPFHGIVEAGTYAFMYVTAPLNGTVIISGFTYRDMDGNPGYLAGTDLPINRAVIRSPGSYNFISYSDKYGHYGTYGFTARDVCRTFAVTAIHPQNMYRNSANITTCDAPYIKNDVNFKLADKDTKIPDNVPPAISLNLQVVSGQTSSARFVAGTVPVGTNLMAPITIIDQEMGTASLTVNYRQTDTSAETPSSVLLSQGSFAVNTPITGNIPATFKYSYSPTFGYGMAGSQPNYFKPAIPGIYTLVVDATDTAGIKNKQSVQVHAVESAVEMPKGVDGPPIVDEILPTELADNVLVSETVSVVFSESVQSINENTVQLIDKTTALPVPAFVTSGIVDGKMRATLTPKGNLFYASQYEIVVKKDIKDTTPNASAPAPYALPEGDGLLPLDKEYHSTFTTKAPKAYDLAAADQFKGGRDIDLYMDLDAGSTYAYVAAGDSGWRIVDVTNPAKPAVLKSYNMTDAGVTWSIKGISVEQNASTLGITEDIRYSDQNQYGYVRFYDLGSGQAANPQLVGKEKLAEAYSGIPIRLDLYGNFAYVATVGVGLQVVDINAAKAFNLEGKSSDGSTIVGIYDTAGLGYGDPQDIAAYKGGRAALTTSNGYLVLLDITMPQVPQLIDDFRPMGYTAMRAAVTQNFGYADQAGISQILDLAVTSSKQGKINTVDLTDPYQARVIGTAKDAQGNEVMGLASDIRINKDKGVAIVTTYNAILVVDIKDPYNPRLVNTITRLPDEDGNLVEIGSTLAMSELNGWVFMTNNNKGMRSLELLAPLMEVEPKYILLDNAGKPNQKTISYTLNPPDYDAEPAKVVVYKNGAEFKSIPTADRGGATAKFADDNETYDSSNTYYAQVVLKAGTNKEVRSEKIPFLNGYPLITDYNRSKKIDMSDDSANGNKARAAKHDTFYFWINDDTDDGETSGTDIPGDSDFAHLYKVNGEDEYINGARDLIDFFPVYLNLKDLLKIYEPNRYMYKLKASNDNMRFALTELTPAAAGQYLTGSEDSIDPAYVLRNKPTYRITKTGFTINTIDNITDCSGLSFLLKIQNEGKGIILVEGVSAGTTPLVLDIVDSQNYNNIVFTEHLDLSLAGVEQMFRHKNLVQEGGGPVPDADPKKGEQSRLNTWPGPPNYPDKECTGDPNGNGKNFVFVHGYNVNQQQARGFHAEMFKRMYWSGSKARFWAVSWYGYDTQEMLGVTLPATRNYHINVHHAFDTAPVLASFLTSSIQGDISIAAHSLGNMVVSSMLSDTWRNNITTKVYNYFMIDAAVAMEAYDKEALQEIDVVAGKRYMEHPDWNGYTDKLFASEWNALPTLAVTDARRTLTWRDRFKGRPEGTSYYNFYSSGEEVLGKLAYNVSSWGAFVDIVKNSGKYSWVMQERLKGRLPLGWMLGSTYGGWGFNSEWSVYEQVPDPELIGGTTTVEVTMPSDQASQISFDQLKEKPFFKKGSQDEDLFTTANVAASTIDINRRARLLAEAFPALTLPAGANKLFTLQDNNFDMQAEFRPHGWPAERHPDDLWLHSDIKNVAYPYVYQVFEKIVSKQ